MQEKGIEERKLLRKVQVTGGSTYIVSIPKEWAKKIDIDKGASVYIELVGNSLKIYSAEKKEGRKNRVKEILIDSELMNSAIIMEIISAYLAGYDSIKLNFSPTQSSKIEKIINNVRNKVVGLEILEQSENSILLQAVVDLTSISVKRALENMIKTLKSMLDDFIESLSNLNKDVLKSIIKRDDVMDKLYLYISKQLNLAIEGDIRLEELGMKSLRETISIYTTVKNIERIGDHIVSMATWLLETIKGIEFPEEFIELIDNVKNEIFNLMDRIENGASINEFLRTYSSLYKLVETERNLTEALKTSKNFYEIYPVVDGIRRSLANSIDIVEAHVALTNLRELNKIEKN
ncbi:MAG: phosphate uptake regulator PhoU [Caldisphaeraceae archaeon]|nr:phosphate uptake regulator PhoU [Caldisphaeraceae archaeon]